MMQNEQEPNNGAAVIQGIISLAVLGYLAWLFLFGGLEHETKKTMDGVYSQVSQDMVAQYRLVEKSGSAIDLCVQAGMVSAAFLQEQNSVEYDRWKVTESNKCRAAGIEK